MTKKRIPKLLVFFDTNVLFTKVASDLVRFDVQRIIKENSNHIDLNIGWYLPDVVVEERRYQMLGKARELLPNMQKLEKLLGHQFGVGEDTLELHVEKIINTNIDEYELQIKKININEVDWNNVISRSVKRLPPFEANEKEKGFRDSIIANCFKQLHVSSPSTPSICRLAFVSEDQLLREYVKELTVESNNVRILSSLDELESLINTLVSTVPEELAAELSDKANSIFFEKENDKTFYYKENIGEKIRDQFAEELNEKMILTSLRNNGTWWILPPIFIKKERQRVHWVSTIEPEFEIFHYEADETTQNQAMKKGLGIPLPTSPAQGLNRGLLEQFSAQKKIIDLKGRETFEVHWSTNLTQAKNLTSPRIEKIQYIGNELAGDNS